MAKVVLGRGVTDGQMPGGGKILAMLNIESQLTVKINYSDTIEDFATSQFRKKLH